MGQLVGSDRPQRTTQLDQAAVPGLRKSRYEEENSFQGSVSSGLAILQAGRIEAMRASHVSDVLDVAAEAADQFSRKRSRSTTEARV